MFLQCYLLLSFFLLTKLAHSMDPEDTSDWEPEFYGGHSREFRSIHQPTDWDSLTRGHTRKIRRVLPEKDIIDLPSDDEIRDFIKSHRSASEVLTANMKEIVKNEWVYQSLRIKSFRSVRGKLIRKNDTLARIKDTIGLRITAQTVTGVRNVHNLILASPNKTFTIIEIRCYGICSNASMKHTQTGYRRIHLLVKVNPFDKWAEIQLGTLYTTLWSDWGHDSLYKGKFAETNDSTIRQYGSELGDYLYQLDEARDKMPPCPFVLENANAKALLEPEVYAFLYNPINLCFLWNDIFLTNPVFNGSAVPSSYETPVINSGLKSRFDLVLIPLMALLIILL